MTAIISEAAQRNETYATGTRVNIVSAWLSSFAVYVSPKRVGRVWLGVTPAQAVAVNIINCVLGVVWFALAAICYTAWNGMRLRKGFMGPWQEDALARFRELFDEVPRGLWLAFRAEPAISQFGIVIGGGMVVLVIFAVLFFVLLPFAARPGSNDACFRHTFRAALLSSGIVHFAFPVFSAVFLLLAVFKFGPGFENAMVPLLATFAGVSVWGLAALITAVRTDYRRERDMPGERDRLCEECGYDLRMAELDSRCPECGKPVSESLGDDVRRPLAWEERPSLMNVAGIISIVQHVIFSPRAMFFGMLTRSYQWEAQRWLILWVTVAAFVAYWVSPATVTLGLFELTYRVFVGGVALSVVWVFLALMMVGIETAGITAFARFRGHKIEVASAAKVTAYASPLLVVWVVLASLQILLMAYWYQQNLSRMYGIRAEQIVFTVSTAVAHIGGLLWFELTVYRGVRAIQYARH